MSDYVAYGVLCHGRPYPLTKTCKCEGWQFIEIKVMVELINTCTVREQND